MLAASDGVRMQLIVTKALSAAQKGDLAIALAQIASIRKRFPSARITAFVRRPTLDRHWFADVHEVAGEIFCCNGFESGIGRIRRLITCLIGCGYDRPTREYHDACTQADMLIFCGGGSPGGYGRKQLLRNAVCPVLLARRAGIPVYFSGLSVAPTSNWFRRKLTAWTLNQANAITLRDPLSADVLKAMGVTTPAHVTADWAVLLEPIDRKDAAALLRHEGVPIDSHLVGMNLRDIDAINPEGRADRANTPYMSHMRHLIEWVVLEMDADLAIFSMNRPPSSNDLGFAERVIRGLPDQARKRVHVLRKDYTPSQLKGMIGEMQLFIGTRLHPTIFAVSMAVPAVTIHDQTKVKGFMQLVGLDKWHIPLEDLGSDTAWQTIATLQEQRYQIRQHLQGQLDALTRRAESNLDPIAEAVTERRDH